jgi:hypothetical protein
MGSIAEGMLGTRSSTVAQRLLSGLTPDGIATVWRKLDVLRKRELRGYGITSQQESALLKLLKRIKPND